MNLGSWHVAMCFSNTKSTQTKYHQNQCNTNRRKPHQQKQYRKKISILWSNMKDNGKIQVG